MVSPGGGSADAARNSGSTSSVCGVITVGGGEVDFCAAALSGAATGAGDGAGGIVGAGADTGVGASVAVIGADAVVGGAASAVVRAGESSPEVSSAPESRNTTSGATESV
jgi:hypothetical protein